MPTELRIPAVAEGLEHPGYPEQRAMHAILMGALDAADPALAERVHEMHTKPFTQALRPDEEGGLLWRVAWLDDELAEPFRQGLARLAPDRLLERPLALHAARATAAHTPYAALAAAPAARRFRLTFHTPTTFKQQYYQEPVPGPYLCFQSWWSRWNHFAPAEHAINVALLDVVAAHVVTSRFRIRSVFWQDGRRRAIGALGKMTFAAIRGDRVEEAWWRRAAALAAFSRFCGTGYKTTQGMGQTELRE